MINNDNIAIINQSNSIKINDTIRNNTLEKLACLRRVRAIFHVESSFPAIGDNKSKNTPFSNNYWLIAFIFRTGGLRTSFYQLNCDPLEFSLYTPSLEFPRNIARYPWKVALIADHPLDIGL